MSIIYLDTAILAVPNYAVDAKTGQEIIDRLIHFSDITDQELPLKLVISDYAEEILWGQNLGPDYEQIDQFLEIMELKHIYSTHDLLQRYHTILQICLRASEASPIDAKSVSDFRSDPALPDLSPTQMMHETQRIFASAAAVSTLSQRIWVGSAFDSSTEERFDIEAQLDEFGGCHCEMMDKPPIKVASPVVALTHLRNIVSAEFADYTWRSARNASDLHFAITLGALALQIAGGEELSYGKLKPFALGSEFAASLEGVECARDGRFSSTLRELCSQIVAGKCSRQINPFSLTGQYSRDFDGAKAWRTHVTNGGLALRLMHWATEDMIEFANVDVKKGEKIEKGATRPAAALNFSNHFG
ncbi:hypothetical protein [Shinella zoogloeoides]|uniref:hypothetical protein n=1 Tax=Shinella zoogloeoides TaxID=352475 RepID=UPI00273E4B2C|nr:hypothetical protein [Shinella zoogloeoides]WLR93883.1 hypothetical protein Q9316_06765 [Shinella zoogloeoides]